MNVNDLLALSLGGLAVFGAGSAAAQGGACGPHADVMERLEAAYGETLKSAGLAATGVLVETYASDAGTWTIVVTDASGQACLLAAGEAWQVAPTLPKGEGA